MSKEDRKFIVFRGDTVELSKNPQGFWTDHFGTIYAFTDANDSIDPIVRCGIGIFSLGIDDPRNAACKSHDYMYSSPVYQAFNTRAEADFYLLQTLKHSCTDSLSPHLFYFISRQLGGFFWENEETNN